MTSNTDKFGAFIRRDRDAKKIGLRAMAKMIGVSPTYLSKIERDEFPPPTEDKVRAIAKILGSDADDLVARAGRVPVDVTELIKRRPKLSEFVRGTASISDDEIERFLKSSRNKSR